MRLKKISPAQPKTASGPISNLAALDYDAGNLKAAVIGWRRYLQLDDTTGGARTARAGTTLVAQIGNRAR